MSVLRRKLFNRGGPVSSRGVGITSGLVPRYSHGGPVSEHTSVTDKFTDNMEMLRGLNLYQPRTFDAKENMTPYLLDLSARLLGGTSKRGGIGGALEIGGQAMAGASPLLSQALQNKREFEATDQEAPLKQMALQMALEKDDPRFEYKVIGDRLAKIDTKGELPPEFVDMPEDPPELRSDPKTVYGNFGENNTGYAQMFTFKDGKVEYRKDGQVFTKDQFSPLAEPKDEGKATVIQKSLPNNMVQDQISYDGKTFTDFGAPYPRYKPEVTGKLKQVDQVYGTFGDSATPQYGQLFRYDDKVIYKVGGEEFENFTPTEKPKDQPTPIFQSKNIGDGMIQDEISTDNGLTFTTYGEAYPRFKADKEDQYNYSNTAERTITTKDGKKIKQTYAIYNKPGVTEPKKYLMFEEEVTDDPSVRRSGNVVITEGPSQGQRYGAVELKDGSVLFHDPMNPLANDQGLVPSTTYKGKFEYYGTTVTGDPESVFGGQNVEDIANAAAETANSLASGAALINDALSLEGNLDTLNRSILDKGGKILSQIPILGDDAKAALFDAFDADPQALQSFITNARIFVAQQIAAITGEDSGRISEPERFLANQALATLDAMTDAQSAIAAIQASVAATYVQQHRNLLVVGGDNKPLSVYDPNGKNGFSEAGIVFHANRLATKFGFDQTQVQRTLKVMRDMEELGLQELTSVSQDQQSHFQNNKNAINSQYAKLIGGQ